MGLPISGHDPDLIQELVDIGLIPDNTRKITIEIAYDSCVMLNYETYADKRLYDVNWLKHLKATMKPRNVKKRFAWLRRKK